MRIVDSITPLHTVGARIVLMVVRGGNEGGEAPPRTLADDAMERYADGEAAAFSTLYDVLAPRLFRFAVRRLRSHTAAEDVVQQTFLHIHCARDRFARGAAVLPWAYAIARRLAIDGVRRRGREDLRADPMGVGGAQPGAAAPDEVLHRKRSEAALRSELDRLPPAQREAFELLKVEGLSVAECAEVLGITHGMVKVRAHRATVALRSAQLRRDGAVAPGVDAHDSREEEVST
jgi:RNA polymerase sigma-70 factor (ECF subfamily)